MAAVIHCSCRWWFSLATCDQETALPLWLRLRQLMEGHCLGIYLGPGIMVVPSKHPKIDDLGLPANGVSDHLNWWKWPWVAMVGGWVGSIFWKLNKQPVFGPRLVHRFMGIMWFSHETTVAMIRILCLISSVCVYGGWVIIMILLTIIAGYHPLFINH